jgi:ribosomal protein L34
MKRTFQPNKHRKSKKFGFFARKATDILKTRKAKGRKVLCK